MEPEVGVNVWELDAYQVAKLEGSVSQLFCPNWFIQILRLGPKSVYEISDTG